MAALVNCTLSGNEGSSVASSGADGIGLTIATASLINTIVAGNPSLAGASDIGGTGTASSANNLIEGGPTIKESV
jgi:hypothetical protein